MKTFFLHIYYATREFGWKILDTKIITVSFLFTPFRLSCRLCSSAGCLDSIKKFRPMQIIWDGGYKDYCCFESLGLDYEGLRECRGDVRMLGLWRGGSCNEDRWVERDLWRDECWWIVYVRCVIWWEVFPALEMACLMTTSTMVIAIVRYVGFVAATNGSANTAFSAFRCIRVWPAAVGRK